MPAVVEIAVTFARSTLLQLVRVPYGAPYRIGRGPDTDLALDVEPTMLDTRVAQAEHEFGLVRITMTCVAEPSPPPPLARRPLDHRPLPFLAASLLLHVAIVAVAMATVELAPITVPIELAPHEPPPSRLVRIEARPPRTPPPAAAASASRPADPSREAGAPTTAGTPSTAGSEGMFGSLANGISQLVGTADLAKELADVGPIYDEEAANRSGFGGGAGRFDPSQDARFDSVKTGRYDTVATGRGAGAHYRLPASAHGRREVERPPLMALACDDASCIVEGPLDRFRVRDIIERRYVDLVKCYERTSRTIPRVEITLRFDIEPTGIPGEVVVDGHEDVGRCVARIVARTKFPANEPTRVVTYPMAFWRS